MEFGGKLKELRKSHHLTQVQLAERLGVGKSVVSYYESGDRFPSYDVLTKLARIFHVTTDYLLDVESTRTLNVSQLREEDIAVVEQMIDALSRKTQ